MQLISLEQRPNQAFSVVIENHTYRVRIVDGANGFMLTDVTVDTNPVALGVRALHGDFAIPLAGSEFDGVNFMWFDDDGRAPHWENFGTDATCRLFYVKIPAKQRSRTLAGRGSFNPGPLFLDGTWNLDGTQILDGVRRI